MPSDHKGHRDKRKIPCYVHLQGIGKVWIAWVQLHQTPSGKWRNVQKDRIVRVRRKHPSTAVVAAILAWRRRGYRTCQRCGARYVTIRPRSKWCAVCGKPWRYNLEHHLGRRAFAMKRAELQAKALEAKRRELADECIAKEYANVETGGDNAGE